MIYIRLFLSFLLIGFTSFGGLSMIPLINSEMISNSWMTASEVSDIVAIAEMTPGPMGINCATFAGSRVAGIAGALCASLGVIAPSVTLCLLAAMFLKRFQQSRVLQNAMYGIRPICVGMIVAVIIKLSISNYIIATGISWQAVSIGVISFIVLYFANWSVPKTIAMAAVLGLVLGNI